MPHGSRRPHHQGGLLRHAAVGTTDASREVGAGWSLVRPGYSWPWIDANDRRSALEATRAAVAAWLGVELDAFDVVSG
jgi:hypothetical protein